MKNLISMTDFVLEQSNNQNLYRALTDTNGKDFMNVWGKIFSYAQFLKQPLQMRFFVPCDDDGKVLQQPVEYDRYLRSERMHMHPGWKEKCYEYKQAKTVVLFEGFKQVKIGNFKHDIVRCDDFEINLTTLNCGQFVEDGYLDFQLSGNTIEAVSNVIKSLQFTDTAHKSIFGYDEIL